MNLRGHLLLFGILSLHILAAQDTIRVQTLTYDSITTRRGWWAFPDSTHTFRKVLMHHTLKCDPQTTQDQYNCGEWDYLTYNMVHQHTGLLDSNALQHPWFKVGSIAPDSADMIGQSVPHMRERNTLTGQVLSVTNSNATVLGTSNNVDSLTFRGPSKTVRSQFIYTASELLQMGVLPGVPIHQLKFNGVYGNGAVWLVVRIGTTLDSVPSLFVEDLSTVHDGSANTGDSVIVTLGQPFVYNGTGHLVLDLTVERASGLLGCDVEAMEMGSAVGLRESGLDGYVELDNDVIGVNPDALGTLGSAVTITFRAWGADVLPINTTILEATDDEGRRLLNVHLPWSDSRVYWDAGNDGAGYDRIDKAATAAQIKGQWNDWAFVKNVTTGSMKIYLNGALWHAGSGKTKPLTGITSFKLGCDANGNLPYQGLLDEVNIFATEVSAATIAAWAGRRVTAAHPDHSLLLQQFSFDEDDHIHHSVNTVDATDLAWLLGTVKRAHRPTTELTASPAITTRRPLVVLVQGDHVVQTDTTPALHQDGLGLLTIEHFAVQGNAALPYDTLFGYPGGWSYTYDTQGEAYDSTYNAGTWHYNNILNYFGVPYPEIIDYEIGRYITPYGIGLSLGPQGFRWTFDVTDYQWLLHDSVELSAGNQQELIDLEFEMIEGTPSRPLVKHTRPWGGLNVYSYANLDNDVSLPAVTVSTDPDATQWSLRTRFTGHGHNSNNGQYPHCCEWKDNTHYAFANGSQIDAWHIWQEHDCAENPVFPQGGTWLGSREGWCPGDVVKDHSVEITPFVSNGQVTLDYDITPVPTNNQGMGGGSYVVNMDLLEYGPCANTLDAEVYLVKRPSDADYYRRMNPICTPPLVTLRNAGSTTLTSALFTYSVSGGVTGSYTWTGSLPVDRTVDVELPVGSGAFWNGDGSNLFTVTVSAPNGAADQYSANDSYTTHFDLPEVFTDNFVLSYKTNNRPWENTLTITDMWGTVVFGRTNHTASAIYSDTLQLSPGCYTFEFLDTGNDGLSYWADPGQGNGYFRWRGQQGGTLETFEPEFGRRLFKPFVIGDIVGLNEQKLQTAMSVFPNPSRGQFTVAVEGLDGVQRLQVMDMNGRIVRDEQWNVVTSARRAIDMTDAPSGLYTITLTSAEGTLQQRLVIE